MRTLTPLLLTAQKSDSRIPAVRVEAKNLTNSVVNLKWERLYTRSEDNGPHALTLPGDGSLLRLRITPPADNRKLYRQRVTSPGPVSDFSAWTYLSQYNILACAACSLGAEVSLFWVKGSGEIDHAQSSDYGAAWPVFDYPGYAPIGNVNQMAAAYKPNGDLALFFTDATCLYVIQRLSGVWQSLAAWDKTTGDLFGVATVYDGDWKLLVNGKDTAGNFKVWSVIFGDGDEIATGSWSALKEIASSPSDAGYEFTDLFLDKPDTFRCFFTEKYSGVAAYNRPFWSHTLPDTAFLENRWREPVPFETESEHGLALAHSGDYAWLEMPSGIWRASLWPQTLDLSPDILAIKSLLDRDNGELTVVLDNNSGKYNSHGTGDLSILETGCQIDFSPGYRTTAGNEYSSGLSFALQAFEYVNSPGRANLVLYASNGWKALENWTARGQLRWNQTPATTPVKEILAQVLARAGIKLNVISESSTVTGFYPDFTIHPGENGKATIKRLLSYIPDTLFLEGNAAYLMNPLVSDLAVYTYGTDHVIYEGRYRSGAGKINRVKVEGPGALADSFAWEEIQRQGDILEMVEDINIGAAGEALERGAAYLRQAEVESESGSIRIPVNCGQQPYDVIAIIDPGAGLAAAKRRVLGMTLTFVPAKGEYEQTLRLGGV